VTAAPASPVVRWARLLVPRRNPLARRMDRWEGRTLILAVLVALLLLPVMLVLGSLTYAAAVAKGEQQARTRHQVVATLTEDAPAPTAGAWGNATGSFSVRATWRLPDGSAHTGLVRADDGLGSGARVPIWVDRQGRGTDAPVTSADAGAAAATIAASGWLAVVGVLALAQFGLHRLFGRRRHRAWEREWAQVEPGWNTFRR
jgi:hypothetical protein